MIVKVNGSYPLCFDDGEAWCGVDDTNTLALGVAVHISKSYFEYTGQPGGVMPVDDVIKLQKFLAEWLRKYKHKKGTYYEKTED